MLFWLKLDESHYLWPQQIILLIKVLSSTMVVVGEKKFTITGITACVDVKIGCKNLWLITKWMM